MQHENFNGLDQELNRARGIHATLNFGESVTDGQGTSGTITHNKINKLRHENTLQFKPAYRSTHIAR